MASAIYRAFKEYKREFEKENDAWEYRKKIVNSTSNESEKVKTINPVVKQAVDYRVQFYTSPRQLPLSDSRFKGLDELSYYEHNGVYKYTSGSFATLDEATTHRKVVRSTGFSDAFVVAFHKDSRVSISEAKVIGK
jgi:N-acetylmuramoyl-L-alanine amidase